MSDQSASPPPECPCQTVERWAKLIRGGAMRVQIQVALSWIILNPERILISTSILHITDFN